MKLKNIIFDFGGVLFDVNYHKTRDAFLGLGVANFDDFYSQTHCSPLFSRLEKGLIEPDDFYESFRQQTGQPVETPLIREAWCAMLLGFREKSMEFLDKLKPLYNIFLLSNTNAIHYEVFQRMHKEKYNKGFNEHFHKPYYSHLIMEHKPNAAAYEVILQENSLVAGESLYVDDTFKNIKPAEDLGMQVCFLHSGGLIEEELKWLLENSLA